MILNRNERVLWRGKPRFAPFVFPSIFAIFVGLFFMAIPVFMYFMSGEIFILLFPHFWIGLLIAVGGPLYAILVHKHVEYAITDKRIIIQKGLIGRDFNSIDYEKVQDLSVNVGAIDKLFGTGSIISSSAGLMSYHTYRSRHSITNVVPGTMFRSIERPYHVFKILKRVTHDVKTDIYFPNKYRPRENVGYRTQYRPRTRTHRPAHRTHRAR